jgi:hypothetical protein
MGDCGALVSPRISRPLMAPASCMGGVVGRGPFLLPQKWQALGYFGPGLKISPPGGLPIFGAIPSTASKGGDQDQGFHCGLPFRRPVLGLGELREPNLPVNVFAM